MTNDYATEKLRFQKPAEVYPVAQRKDGKVLSGFHVSGIAIAEGTEKPHWYYLQLNGKWSRTIFNGKEYTGKFGVHSDAVNALAKQLRRG